MYDRAAPVGPTNVGSALGVNVKLRVAPAIGAPNFCSATANSRGSEPVLVTWKLSDSCVFGAAVTATEFLLNNSPWPVAFGAPSASLIDNATSTARSELMSPAPCSLVGALKSVAELMMMRLTNAGDGSLPPCVLRYA